jgi:hypothetical protein
MTSLLFPPKPEGVMVSTRPISMTSESVNAIRAKRKTQTRRVMYPQPTAARPMLKPVMEFSGSRPREVLRWVGGDETEVWNCPYGRVGDRLWVREVWARVEPYPGAMQDYGVPLAWKVEKNPTLLEYWRQRVIHFADFPGKKPEDCGRGATDNLWRSPMSMPRWASRLLLEVTRIWPERVQEISADDAIAEGVETAEGVRHRQGNFAPGVQGWMNYGPRRGYNWATPQESYESMWDAINRHKNPWVANPWVWCVEFREIEWTMAA